MRSQRISRWAAGAIVALTLCVAASSAEAQQKSWDQKAVTALAQKLAASLRDLRVTVRRNPQATKGSPQRQAQFRARDSLRLLVVTSQRLATQLKGGADMDETLPTFRRLQSLRRDAETDGRRADIPAPTLERITSVQALIDQLAAYYQEAPAAPASEAKP
ncbi:MAG TPA: hypothetical protein VMH82_15590 [Myxococcota bacterium]|nr:hypothetical protein [Myxococcota bacterium]